MPALSNPHHKAFAQAIFAGLSDGQGYSQGRAYLAAGYQVSNANSANAAASRLLRKVKPILDRVRELQAESMARRLPAIDLSRDRVGRDLDEADRVAREERNAPAMLSSAPRLASKMHSPCTTSGASYC